MAEPRAVRCPRCSFEFDDRTLRERIKNIELYWKSLWESLSKEIDDLKTNEAASASEKGMLIKIQRDVKVVIDAEFIALETITSSFDRFSKACDRCPGLQRTGDEHTRFRDDVEKVKKGLRRYKAAVFLCQSVLHGKTTQNERTAFSEEPGEGESYCSDSAYGTEGNEGTEFRPKSVYHSICHKLPSYNEVDSYNKVGHPWKSLVNTLQQDPLYRDKAERNSLKAIEEKLKKVIDAELIALKILTDGFDHFNEACNRCLVLSAQTTDGTWRQLKDDVEAVKQGLNRYKAAVSLCYDVLHGKMNETEADKHVDESNGEEVYRAYAGESRCFDSAYGTEV